MDSTCVCLHTHKHTHAHIVLLQFLNCHQEWFIYTSIGCSSLWKLLTDPKEFCVVVFLKLTSLPWSRKKCKMHLERLIMSGNMEGFRTDGVRLKGIGSQPGASKK